ncbi:gamma-butyrobetaine dioxygenase-like [Penaeus japonicus]|uniref:gamma-butyrobetaine dioxygenase-like n=1 Tax=Penaeus japonicus TaxID=27405 RepID=UPI001C71525A|nr:gamma-butyrobetaine dioxygenase-like [Penaeus japonicus]XP_042861314.1 gamma-butyrobetaine dioxygenase-like [Penaeus japonicus]
MLAPQLLSRGGVSLARISAASTRVMAVVVNAKNSLQRIETRNYFGTSKANFVDQFRFASTVCNAAQTPKVVVTAAEADHKAAMLKIQWGDGMTDVYPFIWLRDNCQCSQCFESSSLARKLLLQQLSRDVHPTSVQVTADGQGVGLEWSDGHSSVFSASWLDRRAFNNNRRNLRVQDIKLKKALWDSDRAKDLSQFSFSDLLTSDTELLKFLQQVEEYGLCIIKEAPPEPGQIERLTESIGHLKRTHYGLVFSVKIKANANNLAYTEKSLNLHVDQPYLEYKPGVQLLHCISQCEGHGGENILVDSFCVAEKLRQTQPEKFELLTDTLVDFYDVGVEEGVNFHVINQEPIIKLDKSGQVKTVSLNNMVRDSHFGCQPEHVMAWYDAMMTYHDLLSDPQYAITYKMAKGDIIVFDNNRVLHGRKGFHMTGGERHLEGCYWDWDVVRSRRRVLLADAGLN